MLTPFALLFLALVGALAFTGYLPTLVAPAYLLASLGAFLLYRGDKAAARSGAWRTPESTLHVLGVLGGWPGALIAQQVLRHKSRKASFQIVFWTTVALNAAALVWLFNWHVSPL
jgi:uncharacterized membrane protein YsdA (DUF1294 family)